MIFNYFCSLYLNKTFVVFNQAMQFSESASKLKIDRKVLISRPTL